jgi:diguanylate cyclase (GGDEF)-like protein
VRISLRLRIAAVMWLLVAAMGVSTAVIADRYLSLAFDHERLRRVQEEAGRVDKLVVRRQRALADEVDLLADHPDVAGMLQGTVPPPELGVLRQALELDVVALVDPTGRMIATAAAGKVVQDLPVDVIFRQALEGIGTEDVVLRGDEFELRATRPVMYEGQVIGAAMAGYLLDDRLLEQIHGETGLHAAYTFEASVLDSTLRSFDRVDSRAIFGVKHHLVNPLDPIAAGSSEFVRWPVVLDGEPFDAVFCPLINEAGGAHLGTLVLLVSARPLLDTRAQARRWMLFSTSLGLLVSTLLALLLATGLARPIQHVANVATAMREGDLSRRTGIRRSDAIGDMALAFDGMAESLQQHVEEIHRLAVTDDLTKLSNHRRFKEELEREIQRAERNGSPLCLIFLDLDHFKQVNDTHGHDQGDEVLRAVARVLRVHVRTVDLPCRYGGEEFAVILPETELADAMVVAERLRFEVQDRPMGKGIDLRVTISAGVAVFPTDGATSDDLLKTADNRLYLAKERGRNCVVFGDEAEG